LFASLRAQKGKGETKKEREGARVDRRGILGLEVKRETEEAMKTLLYGDERSLLLF
jgi:hypothetical protein